MSSRAKNATSELNRIVSGSSMGTDPFSLIHPSVDLSKFLEPKIKDHYEKFKDLLKVFPRLFALESVYEKCCHSSKDFKSIHFNHELL